MSKEKLSKEAQTPPLRKGAVISRIFFGLLIGLLILVVSVNLGKWIGIGLFKLIMWLGILPYLEKFFGWFVF